MYYSNPSDIISKKYSDIYDLIQLIFMKFELYNVRNVTCDYFTKCLNSWQTEVFAET